MLNNDGQFSPDEPDPALERIQRHMEENFPDEERLRKILSGDHSLTPQELREERAELGLNPHSHDELMGRWDRLNEAGGGDLYTNNHKLAAMRRVDRAMPAVRSAGEITDEVWAEFEAAVLLEISQTDLNGPEPRTEFDMDALDSEVERLDLTTDQRIHLISDLMSHKFEFFNQDFGFIEGSVQDWAELRGVTPSLLHLGQALAMHLRQ